MGFLKFCRFERKERELTIHIAARSVTPSPGELSWEMIYLVDRFRPDRVALDFSQVLYFSTEGINELLKTRKHVLSKGASLKIVGMHKSVRAKFRALRLDGHVFDIAPTPDSPPSPTTDKVPENPATPAIV